MKLFFDARYIRTDFHDGISRYSTELGKALATLTPVTFLICDEEQRKYLPSHAQYILLHKPTSAREPFTARILNKYRPDVVFSPMQTMGAAGRRFKLILTSHDMIYYRHSTPPRSLNLAIRIGWRAYHLTYTPQRIALNSADIVATVSETSKKDFLAANLTKRPIVVLPNAPQQLATYLEDSPRRKQSRNLVYMGSFMRYKNVETLISAMEELPEYTLHLLSRISPKRKSELLAGAPKGASIVFHGGVSDKRYAELLANDAILVSASLDEGYGLPLAEAAALGVPAVVSDIPIFHEVAGNGALYAAPTNPKDFAQKITSLADASFAKKVGAAGQQHIARFNWHTSAEALLQTARSLTSK